MLLFMKKHFMHKGFSIRLYMLTLGMRLRQSLSFIQLPFKNSYRSKKISPFFIRGDSAEKLKEKLAAHQIPVSEIEYKNSAVVFAESNSLSWKKIIDTVRQESKGHIFYFHGSGTHALVGSHSKAKQGEIIVL